MAIIGVVGASGDKPDALWEDAEKVGKAVVAAGHILLTGGDGSKEYTVKDRAMVGSAGKARISVLPKGTPRVHIDGHQLIIQTGIESDARNVINGFMPDGLIALRGRAGTLSEVAYALWKGKPVVFVGSRQALLDALPNLREKLQPGLRAYPHLTLDPDVLIERATKELNGQADVDVTNALKTLESRMKPNGGADYPGIPATGYRSLVEDLLS